MPGTDDEGKPPKGVYLDSKKSPFTESIESSALEVRLDSTCRGNPRRTYLLGNSRKAAFGGKYIQEYLFG